MATRFYFQTSGAGIPTISPSFDSGWENLNGSVRRRLVVKQQNNFAGVAAGYNSTQGIPITVGGDYVIVQYISDPLKAQYIDGTFSMVQKMWESDAGVNATMSVVVKVVSQDGSITRGILYSVFGTDTETVTGEATRIVNAQSVTPLTILAGDRIVIELGITSTIPTVDQGYGGNRVEIFIDNSDFALTSGLTTNLNNWCEFSKDLIAVNSPNVEQRNIKVGDGMCSVGRAS